MKIFLRDVSPRDGLQNERVAISTEDKINLIHSLADAGLPAIEVTSFVHPTYVPQMADAEQVMQRITRKPGTSYHVLVPNIRGAERAMKYNPDQINLVVSASDSHNLANVKRKTFDSLDQLKDLSTLIKKSSIHIQGCISTVFGCPFEGKVPIDRVLKVIEAYLVLGVNSINLADTTGMANPLQVKEVLRKVKYYYPNIEVYLHFHNTRGAGIANLFAGIEEGITHFDTSLGGTGGCPFAPGATGNICSEDVVNLLNDAGIETNCNLDSLIEASTRLQALLKQELSSHILKAGKTYRKYSLEQYLT